MHCSFKKIVLTALVIAGSGGAFFATADDASLWVKNISRAADTAGAYNHQNPQIVLSGQFVHIGWLASPAAGGATKLMYCRSADSGKTFDVPKELAASDPADFFHIGFAPTNRLIAASGSNVHVLYTVGWPGKLRYLRSTDNGATFDTARTFQSGYYSYAGIYVAAQGNNVAISWALNGNDSPRPHGLYCAYSSDGGATFATTTVAYSDNTTTGQIEGRNVNGYSAVDMIRSGSNIYLLSSTSVDDGTYGSPSHLRLFTSADNGATFKTPLQVSLKSSNDKHYTTTIHDADYSPNMAASGDTVHVVFYNTEDPGDAKGYSLRVRTSVDAGVTFRDSTVLRNYPANYHHGVKPGLETICRSGSNLFVVTAMNEGAAGTYVWRSRDAGATWDSAQVISGGGWWPQVGVDPANGNTVFVANSWFYRSNDAGATFNGGSNPHLLFVDWQSPQLAAGPGSVAHYVFGSGLNANSYDHSIMYRRLAPEPPAQSSNTCLSLVKNGQARVDHFQVPASPSINFTTAMTAELWVKVDSAEIGYLEPLLTKKRNTGDGSYMIGAWNPAQIYTRIVTDSAADKSHGYWMGSGVTMPKKVWTHIAMTYDSAGKDNWRLYVNGLLTGCTTVKGAIITDLKDAPLVIGRDDVYYSASMMVDDVRLWNKARTHAEIVAGMQSEMAGTEPGLVAWYSLNGTFKDVSGHGNDGMPMYKETFSPIGDKPPRVVSLSPANNDTAVLTNVSLVAVFNEPVTKVGGVVTVSVVTGSSSASVFEQIPVSGDSVTIAEKTVTIRTKAPFGTAKKYYVTFDDTCFKNTGGVYFPGIVSSYSWSFTTNGAVPVTQAISNRLVDRFGIAYRSKKIVFTIATAEQIFYRAKVFSFDGKVVQTVLQRELGSGVHTINIPVTLAAGMYVCELTVDKLSGTSVLRKSIAVAR